MALSKKCETFLSEKVYPILLAGDINVPIHCAVIRLLENQATPEQAHRQSIKLDCAGLLSQDELEAAKWIAALLGKPTLGGPPDIEF